jgi:hypothetical protein
LKEGKPMKYLILILFIATILVFESGCSKETISTNTTITKEFLKVHAKIGMTKSEISNTFGQEAFRKFGDGSYVWIFDKVINIYKYTPDLQRVAFEDIKEG